MREPSVAEPEILIEVFRIDNQGVSFPLADSAAIVKGVAKILLSGVRLIAAVGKDKSPMVIAAADENPDSLPVWLLDELDAVTQLKLSGAAWRFAEKKHRVVLQKIALPQLKQVASPALKRSDLID